MDTITYPPVVFDLIGTPRLAPLGPGRANEAVRSQLKKLTVNELFASTPTRSASKDSKTSLALRVGEPEKFRDLNLAQACLAGLWLYHDFLDESHQISQDLETVEGAYWHGLMHRREPDFANSKYWFRRVGPHEVFVPLAQSAAELAGKGDPHSSAAFLTSGKPWDAFAFIDLCEQAYLGRVPCEQLCRLVQEQEWRLLFDYCYQHALKGK